MMAAYYTPLESDAVKAQRMEREPGVDLVRCSDGMWRTEQEKDIFDRQEREGAGMGWARLTCS